MGIVIPDSPLPDSRSVSQEIGGALCNWWSDLTREQRMWVFNNAMYEASFHQPADCGIPPKEEK